MVLPFRAPFATFSQMMSSEATPTPGPTATPLTATPTPGPTATQNDEASRQEKLGLEKIELEKLPYKWNQTLTDVDVFIPLPAGMEITLMSYILLPLGSTLMSYILLPLAISCY